MVDKYKGKDYKKIIFVNDFEQVARLLAKITPKADLKKSWSQQDIVFACGLRLIHDAIINKEIGRRPSQYVLCQG